MQTPNERPSNTSNMVAEFTGDNRTYRGRRIKELKAAYTAQLGTTPTASQSAMIASAAQLTAFIERDEAGFTRGEDVDQSNYRQNLSALRTVLTQLGITRPTRDLTKSEAKQTDVHAAALMDA